MTRTPTVTEQFSWLVVSMAVTLMAMSTIPRPGTLVFGMTVPDALNTASLLTCGLLILSIICIICAVMLTGRNHAALIDRLTRWHLAMACGLTVFHLAVRLANWQGDSLLGQTVNIFGLLVLAVVIASRLGLAERLAERLLSAFSRSPRT